MIYVSECIVKIKNRQYFSRFFCYLYSAKNIDNMANIPQVTCIYKITSPSGRVYIGQTINARRRYLGYCSKLAKKQPALFRSIIKYGWAQHSFEIIHELPNDVTQDTLNLYECLYMDAYKDCGVVLLNVKEGGSNGRNSADSIKKANDKWKIWYKNNPIEGSKWILSSIESRRGKALSDDHKEKLSSSLKGRVFSDDHKNSLSISTRGKKKNYSEEFKQSKRDHILKFAGKNKSSVNQYSIDGVFIREWDSITLAACELNICRRGIAGCANGIKGRKTFGGYIWRPVFEGPFIDATPFIHNRSPKPKVILQLSLKEEFIAEWPSQTTAAKELGIPIINISLCARGKRKSAGGFTWKYK